MEMVPVNDVTALLAKVTLATAWASTDGIAVAEREADGLLFEVSEATFDVEARPADELED